MKQNLFFSFLIILFFSTGSLNAQNSMDTIQVKRKFGTSYYQGGVKLKMNDLIKITQSNPEAFQAMNKAKSNYNAASFFGFAGGFLVGWPLGTAVAGGDPNWTLAGIGAGLIVISIPLTASFNKHAQNGVRIHNSEVAGSTARRGVNIKMQFTGNGALFRMTF